MIVPEIPTINPTKKRNIDMYNGWSEISWSRQSPMMQQSQRIMVLFSLFRTFNILVYKIEPIRAPTGKEVVHKEMYKVLLVLNEIAFQMEEPNIVVKTKEQPKAKDPMVIPRLHKYMVIVFFSSGLVLESSLFYWFYDSLVSLDISLSFCINILIFDHIFSKIIFSQNRNFHPQMGANIPTIQLTDSLKYEGQLKDTKPHGQGKITYTTPQSDQFIFQGKFTDGQPYYGELSMKNLHYVGQITQRRAEGEGKLLNKQTATTYEGKFIKGKLTQGIVTKKGQYCCKGQFYNEKNEGRKKQSLDDLLHGDSSYYEDYSTKELWKGNFWKGNITGFGEYSAENKISYKGEFRGGNLTGDGILIQQQQKAKLIEGNFSNSLPKVIKKLQFDNGDCFEGEVKNGLFDGAESQYYFSDGKTYKGRIYQHNFTGECQITYPLSSPIQIYTGEVHEGKFNGLGILEYRNGVIVKGYFCENMKNGPCILVYGDRMFKGLFMMDKLIGCLQQIPKDP